MFARSFQPPLLNPNLPPSTVARNATTPSTSYARQFIPCADGGTVALDWWTGPAGWPGESGYRKHTLHPASLPLTAPLLLVLHGLTGSINEGYIKGACTAGAAAGYRCAVLTYRGCGGLALTSPLPYTADGTADAAAAFAAAAAAFPSAPSISAVGYSLGAIILTKYCAEVEAGAWPAAPSLAACVCVSSPFCLASAASRLEEPWTPGWVYNRILASRLGGYFKEHEAELKAHPAVEAARAAGTTAAATTISHWDTAVVAAVAGHPDAAAYYTAASSASHITRISRTPVLFLAAGDDPFLGNLPEAEVLSSPTTALVLSKHGGHCAFLQAGSVLGRAWCDDVLVQWLEGVRAEGRRARL